jgi:hypothetical protein
MAGFGALYAGDARAAAQKIAEAMVWRRLGAGSSGAPWLRVRISCMTGR